MNIEHEHDIPDHYKTIVTKWKLVLIKRTVKIV